MPVTGVRGNSDLRISDSEEATKVTGLEVSENITTDRPYNNILPDAVITT